MTHPNLNACGEVCSTHGCNQAHGCAARRNCAPGLCEGLSTCADQHCPGHPERTASALAGQDDEYDDRGIEMLGAALMLLTLAAACGAVALFVWALQ